MMESRGLRLLRLAKDTTRLAYLETPTYERTSGTEKAEQQLINEERICQTISSCKEFQELGQNKKSSFVLDGYPPNNKKSEKFSSRLTNRLCNVSLDSEALENNEKTTSECTARVGHLNQEDEQTSLNNAPLDLTIESSESDILNAQIYCVLENGELVEISEKAKNQPLPNDNNIALGYECGIGSNESLQNIVNWGSVMSVSMPENRGIFEERRNQSYTTDKNIAMETGTCLYENIDDTGSVMSVSMPENREIFEERRNQSYTTDENIAMETGTCLYEYIDDTDAVQTICLAENRELNELSGEAPGNRSISTDVIIAMETDLDTATQEKPIDIYQVVSGDEGVPLTKSTTATKKRKRRSDRRHFCIYCEVAITNFQRHMLRKHKDKDPIKKYIAIKGKDSESVCRKRRILEEIRLQGDFINNESTIQQNPTDPALLLPVRRPTIKKQQVSPSSFISCKHCFGLFSKKTFYRHAKKCNKLRPSNSSSDEDDNDNTTPVIKSNYIKEYGKPLNPNKQISSNAYERDILPIIKMDEVGEAACNDSLIVGVCNDFLTNHRAIHDRYNVTRKMRDAGRLLLKCKEKDAEITHFADCFSPSKINVVLNSVQELCGCIPDSGEVSVVGMPGRLSWVIQESAKKLLDDALTSKQICTRDANTVRVEVKDFLDIFKRRWKYVVSTNAEKTRKRMKMTKPVVMPDLDDVRHFHKVLSEKEIQLYNNLKTNCTPTNYEQLCKATIAHIILFNCRRSGEVARAELPFYLNRARNNHLNSPDILKQFSAEEIKSIETLEIFTVPGKITNEVPILLTQQMKQSIDLIIDCRKSLRISDSNKFLFARTSTANPFEGAKVLRDIKEEIKTSLNRPQDLTATGLRHHLATKSQLHPKGLEYRSNLTDHLGHNLETHNKNYRVPLPLIRKGQIGSHLLSVIGESSENSNVELSPENEMIHDENPTCYQNRSSSNEEDGEGNSDDESLGKRIRQRWSNEAKLVVFKAFANFIRNKSCPGHILCRQLIKNEPLLKGRKPIQVNLLVDNWNRGKLKFPVGHETFLDV